MRKHRILITGASGLLGLNTALEAAQNYQVFGQVNHHWLSTQAFDVIQTDLLAPQSVPHLLDQTQPDWVIHCAALADIDACERDPVQAEKINTEIPLELAQHVARGGARMLHVSTDAVFDGQQGGYSENDSPNPLSVYARTKLLAEKAVLEANPSALIARVNLFGWSPSGKRSLAEFFFNRLSAGQSCNGFTDVFFCPMLATDLGRLFLKMLENDLFGLYHAVGSECISKFEFGIRIAKVFNFDERLIIPTSVDQSGLTAVRSPNLTLNNSKLTDALGEPLENVSDGIRTFYSQYRQGYAQKIRQMRRQNENLT